jgi:hypothetical protein
MTIFRRVCICLIVIGALLLFAKRDTSFDTMPFPTAGLTVIMTANVTTEGDYFLEASMPKSDQQVTLSEETIPCFLIVILTRDSAPSITNQVTSLSRHAEYGFAGIQYYKGGSWHLGRGEYVVQISSSQDCKAAVSRGATLTLEQEVAHPTERFLAGVIYYWSSVIALCTGALGVVLCELLRTPSSKTGFKS